MTIFAQRYVVDVPCRAYLIEEIFVQFEDYVCSALASVKYADYLLKSGKNDLSHVGSSEMFACTAQP